MLIRKLSIVGLFGLLGLMASTAQASETALLIAPNAEAVSPILPGMAVPKFEVLDARGELIIIDPAALKKPTVITFFRGGWCPYCNMHLAELRHAEKELQEMGFDVWFMSPDKPELLESSLKDPDIGYTLFSDSALDASIKFGIAFRLNEKTLSKYAEYGIDVAKASGEEHYSLPAPSTFIIGTDGRVRFQYTNPDYSVRLHPSILLAAAKAHQDEVDSRFQRKPKKKDES